MPEYLMDSDFTPGGVPFLSGVRLSLSGFPANPRIGEIDCQRMLVIGSPRTDRVKTASGMAESVMSISSGEMTSSCSFDSAAETFSKR